MKLVGHNWAKMLYYYRVNTDNTQLEPEKKENKEKFLIRNRIYLGKDLYQDGFINNYFLRLYYFFNTPKIKFAYEKVIIRV